jgi:hypothetical protein
VVPAETPNYLGLRAVFGVAPPGEKYISQISANILGEKKYFSRVT